MLLPLVMRFSYEIASLATLAECSETDLYFSNDINGSGNSVHISMRIVRLYTIQYTLDNF